MRPLELAAQPEIRFIISNVTEAGIAYVERDQHSDSPPASFPAKLTAFLYHRFQTFAGDSNSGCIMLPTELVEQNGDRIREMVLRYAEQWRLDAGFSQWISDHNVFCNTLVDRIVPGFPSAQSEQILESLGYDDRLLVMGEPYLSWIIEAPDSLKQEFPVHKTNLNVKIVDDANPFRETKVRILNGVHTSMVALGFLIGLEEVREAVEHDALGRFLHDLVYQEIIPSMDLPTAELRQFADEVFDRFRNPYIHHRLLSIAQNSASKIKSRVIPSTESYAHKFNKSPERLTFAFAAFIRFYKGEWNGVTIPMKDDPAINAWFSEQWRTCDSISVLVNAILKNETLWGQDLSRFANFPERLIDLLEQIERDGLLSILERINA
jgi:tagaturonate reductase